MPGVEEKVISAQINRKFPSQGFVVYAQQGKRERGGDYIFETGEMSYSFSLFCNSSYFQIKAHSPGRD